MSDHYAHFAAGLGHPATTCAVSSSKAARSVKVPRELRFRLAACWVTRRVPALVPVIGVGGMVGFLSSTLWRCLAPQGPSVLSYLALATPSLSLLTGALVLGLLGDPHALRLRSERVGRWRS